MSGAGAWHATVVIPARNEADRIERTLRAVLAACRAVGAETTTSVVVVADSCTDDTAERAERALGRRGLVVRAVVGSAGAARALGTAAALTSAHPTDRLWLANTDADTVVPPDWLLVHRALALVGHHAIAGVVRLLDDEASPAFRSRFDRAYRNDEDAHPHVHGANLGVRADAYLDVGGWSALATGEDHDLWGRLRRSSHRTISTRTSEVATSARRHGRAPDGFAGDLVALDRALAAHGNGSHRG